MGRGGVQAREEIRGDTMMGLKRDSWQGVAGSQASGVKDVKQGGGR